MEDKIGKIVSVENATEKQKNQKLGLKLKIAALCTAIGVSGIGIIGLNQYNNSKEEQNKQTVSFDSRDELLQALIDSGVTPEEAKNQILAAEEKEANERGVHTNIEAHLMTGYQHDTPTDVYLDSIMQLTNEADYKTYSILVLQEETRENGEWVKDSVVFTSPYDLPKDSVDRRFVFLGGSNKEPNFLSVWQKETRDIVADDQGNYEIVGDWKTTNEYVIDHSVPTDSLHTRYIFLGTNNLDKDFITDTSNELDKSETSSGKVR